MTIEIIKIVLLAGVLLYVSAMATALNAIAAHNLKFQPVPEAAAVAAAVAVAADSVESVQVKIGGETFFARLVSDPEGEIELAPIRVGDIPDFELAKAALRA